MTNAGGGAPWLLALDTATSRIVVAAGRQDGTMIRVLEWPAGHRHGERLLSGVEELLKETGFSRRDLAGIIVGTGPGAFTGLRVGLATAKTLAHALGLPIVGVGTGAALLDAVAALHDTRPAAARACAMLLPAGPHDRVLVRFRSAPLLLAGGTEPELEPGEMVVAVDLPDRAPAAALDLGARAIEGLGAALLRIGAARLSVRDHDDVDRLVPEYVTLPRGVSAARGAIEWSEGTR